MTETYSRDETVPRSPVPSLDQKSRDLELVIFDCDGVLVDSDRLAVTVDVRVLGELGWEMTDAEVIERFVGHSDAYMMAQIEAHLGRKLPENWEDERQHLYREAFAHDLTPVDGIIGALNAISLPTCVASNGSQEKMRYTLGLTGLYERFAGRLFSVSEVERGKPAPDLLLYAAAQMGVSPISCAVIEDSEPGVAAARAAGMRAFGFAGGLTPANRLKEAGAVVFKHMNELPGLLTKVP